MWKAGVLVSISLPLLVLTFTTLQYLSIRVFVDHGKWMWYERWRAVISPTLFVVSLVLYFIARLSIIAIAFSCFRAMPSSVYVTAWTKYIPTVE